MAIRTDQFTNSLTVVDTVNANASLSLVPQGTGSVSIPGTGQNLAVRSQQINMWSANGTPTLTGNASIAPDGTTTATQIAFTTAGNGVYIFPSLVNGATATYSLYVKNVTNANSVRIGADFNPTFGNVIVDVTTGIITTVGASVTSSSITAVGNGWYRVVMSFAPTTSGISSFVIYNNSGVAQTLLVWGAQAELSSTVGTYVPTTASPIYGTPTLSFSGVSGLGLQSDGSLYASSAGTGNVRLYTNNVGAEQFRVSHTASAVNFLQATGGTVGTTNATLSAQGSDSSVGITLAMKNVGSLAVTGAGGTHLLVSPVYTTGPVVNYLRVRGGPAGNAVVLDVQGGETNAALAFQSKGTGAIDLAAGSSGVNISNGGTVTAITKTVTGTGYSSIPSVAVSAPTTAGGVQSTATCTMRAATTAPIISGGTGYTVGDVLTFVGGTFTSAIRVTVATVSSGVITSVTSTAVGEYSVLPSAPISVTGGTGTGATFSMDWGVANITVATAGSGYVEQPTVTFSGGGGSGAAAYATVGSAPVIKTLTDTLSFNSAGGETVRIESSGGTQTGYLILKGSTGNTNGSYVTSSANSLYLSASAGSPIRFFTNGGGSAEQLRVSHTASAVNYVNITGAATGGQVFVNAAGSDSNIGIGFTAKLFANINFFSAGGFLQFQVAPTASAVNYFQAKGGATGFGAVLSAQGSDTNIPAVVQPKGTGALQAQQTDSTATGGNARGGRAVDWQMSRSSASQVASGSFSVVAGGSGSSATTTYSAALSGLANTSSGVANVTAGGILNVGSGVFSAIVGGGYNTSGGWYNFIGGGSTNSGTANAAVTTQSGTMNGTTAVTLSGSNASIKVGQIISGTSIADDTYVAAISGTSLTLSKVASGSSTSTLSFYTPHGVVVGGGNNQASGSYSFIGGGGDAGTAANRNVASGDWSTVGGGIKNTSTSTYAFVGGGGNNIASGSYSTVAGGWTNTASGQNSFIGSGYGNVASGFSASVIGGNTNIANSAYSFASGFYATSRGVGGYHAFGANVAPIANANGVSQAGLLVLGVETTNATATVLRSDTNAATTTNQVILPNNSAYYFRGEVVSGVTGGGNTKGWFIEGVIKRGANAASTALVGTPTVTSTYADAGASTWVIAVTADTTNGGLAVTFTGQASTTIRTVAQIRTTEMTY